MRLIINLEREVNSQLLSNNFLSYSQDKPKGERSDAYEHCADNPRVTDSPARQSEPYADQYMRQEEEHKVYVKLCVHVSGLLQRQNYPVRPGIPRNQEYDHEYQEGPSANSVELD